jgi:hypothetical protein
VKRAYPRRVLIAFDMLVNVIFDGITGQTISSRAADARGAGRWWGCVLCRWLDKIDQNHCEKAKLGDIRRAQDVIADLSDIPPWQGEDEDDGMCPNCVTPWKCNGPHVE